MKGKYLITTQEFFTAPDGKSYQAVWGDVEVISDSILEVQTNRNSTNWYAKVGDENMHLIVAGCQIQYAIRCEIKPYTGDRESYETYQGMCVVSKFPSKIYIAQHED